jgi:hypothetical protein
MAQENTTIKVQFPDKMKVTSPEIDSLLKVSERISNWLHDDLKNIIEPLVGLKFVPDLIKEVNETMVIQFTNLAQGQIESDVINRQANIKVLNKKIISSEKHIEQKEENLNKTVDRINTRYSDLADQVNKEHEVFLKKLDSHAYDIIEKIYPQQVQERFSYDSLPGTDFLADHAFVTVMDRNICLDKGMKNAENEVTSFMENRKLFHDEIERFHCNELEEGTYNLPFCFIEMENRNTGEIKMECWFECELESGIKNSDLDNLREEMEIRASNTEFNKESYSETLEAINSSLTEKIPESEKQRFMQDLN